ncbi:MAG: hypothetical protein ICV83_10210 [Cytophagales bacterium]|nr:hypothetical protein [Cytophagales bacterium]
MNTPVYQKDLPGQAAVHHCLTLHNESRGLTWEEAALYKQNKNHRLLSAAEGNILYTFKPFPLPQKYPYALDNDGPDFSLFPE